MSVYTGVTHSRLKAISLEADEATITRLNVTDSLLSTRVRFTIAEVNAGATLVPAITGKSIRMVGCRAIAIGGAVGAVTTVDVLGTQTTAVKLVAYAQASLTRSTVLNDSAAGAAVLADGASFVANDVSTGITIGKTGSNVTTATHIDVIFNYVVV